MPTIYSVSDVNTYIKSLLSYDPILSSIWVSGEISNYKRHYTGHLYFTLKDTKGTLKCVMFKSATQSLKFEPENGMKVVVKGNISVFERDGSYQLYADRIQPDGLGELHLAFEQLKIKLEKEGLFDEDIKKPIPSMPHVVTAVTSETGSVIKDIYNVITRRFPKVHLRVYPVAVQGVNAATQIAEAIENLNNEGYSDVIIVGRGGGSLEELWAFNEEVLARAIYKSDIPIISAVGHETDFTIADFVADLRAPTPSAAAELAVPEYDRIMDAFNKYKVAIARLPQQNINIKMEQLKNIKNKGFFKRPQELLVEKRQTVSSYFDELVMYFERLSLSKKNQLAVSSARLDALSPLKILARGYGVLTTEENSLISSVNQLRKNDKINLTLKDGKAKMEVVDVTVSEIDS